MRECSVLARTSAHRSLASLLNALKIPGKVDLLSDEDFEAADQPMAHQLFRPCACGRTGQVRAYAMISRSNCHSVLDLRVTLHAMRSQGTSMHA